MDRIKGVFDSFRVEEAYNWRDDIMEITRRIVHETDEARLNNIAEHFEVDLSEIREFIEMKRKKTQKPLTNAKPQKQTNADRIRAMSDEELAVLCEDGCPPHDHRCPDLEGEIGMKENCQRCWLEWLKAEVDNYA